VSAARQQAIIFSIAVGCRQLSAFPNRLQQVIFGRSRLLPEMRRENIMSTD
jgi:hypothetical protein